MKEISIIVPVYNTERFLDKCLKSLINQSIIEKLKIIIVNDGSKDNSELIIKQFLSEYSNHIEYYKKENGGLSSARNFGIEKCKTKYIGFVDSDDYVEPMMFEKLYKKILNDNSDIVICGIKKCNEDGKVVELEQNKKNITIDNNEALEEFFNLNIKSYACNKIYKLELFNKNNIFYPKGRFYEDVPVMFNLLTKSKKISIIDDLLYNYVQHKESICYTPNFKNAVDIIKNLDDIKISSKITSYFICMTLIQSYIAYAGAKWNNKKSINKKEEKRYILEIKNYKKQIKFLQLLRDKKLNSYEKFKVILFYFNLIKFSYYARMSMKKQ